WIRQLRIHQWAKNVLVLVPLITSHQILYWRPLIAGVTCMVAFSLAASCAYLINDLCDLKSDRAHHRKRHRPLASGEISVRSALIAVPVLAAGAILCLWPLPIGVLAVVSVYFILTLTYSLLLKKKLMVDIVCLAILYALRLLAGHEAAAIPFSSWL